MGSFEFLDHTADVGILATGDSLSDALAWVARGMFSVIADLDTVGEGETLEVEVSSSDREALVVDWLNELLYRYEAEGFLVKGCEVFTLSDVAIRARCHGEQADPARHRILGSVKAATYHMLKVEGNGEWRIWVILDI